MSNFTQEHPMSNFSRAAVPVMLATMLLLTACTSSAVATSAPVPSTVGPTTPAPTRTPQPTSTPRPTNTPAPTSTPTPISGAACLIGKWQVEDLSTYLASLAVPGQVLSESGPITYQFDKNGQARVTVDQFTMKVKAPVQGFTLNLNVVIDGAAAAHYTAISDQLAFSDMQLDGLTVSAGTGKRELFSGTPTEMAELFGLSLDPLFNTSKFNCRANTLTYSPPLQNAGEVTLKRIQ
jgi:hypothetical protein